MELTIKINDKPVTFHTDLSKINDRTLGMLGYYRGDLRLFITEHPAKDRIKITSDKINVCHCAPIKLVEHVNAVGTFDARRLYLYFLYPGVGGPKGYVIQSSAKTYPEFDIKTLQPMSCPPTGSFIRRQVTHLVGQLLEQNGH